jgi:hypothetical protein
MVFMALIALALGTGCKKKDAEVVDVESSSSTATAPTKPAVEAPPTANEKPDTKADNTKADDTKSDDTKADDSKSDAGAKANSKGSSSGPAWITKASEQFAVAFGKRDKSGVYAWAKERKEIQIKLERYSGDKVQSKKEQISDMKAFTDCLTGGPKSKCPMKELPVQFSKAGKVTSCDEECCEFEFDKSELKAKTIILTKACFKAPEGKARPGLKSIKIMHGG